MLPSAFSDYSKRPSLASRQGQRQVLVRSSEQSPSSRRSISERIEQLKRQNDSLKQAIGLFLDKPQDVGAVTGKPTGAWDEGSTASLLDTLRKRPAVDQALEETTSPVSSARFDSAAVAEGEDESQYEDDVPAGPVYDTDLAGPAWMDASGYGRDDSGGSSSDTLSDLNSSEVPADAAASAAATDSPPAAGAAGEAAVSAAAGAQTQPQEAAAGWSSPSSAAATVVGALAALQADILKAVNGSSNVGSAGTAAVVEAPPKPSVLGRIHERLEEMERENQQQQQAASKQQTPAVKPRAKGIALWRCMLDLHQTSRLADTWLAVAVVLTRLT